MKVSGEIVCIYLYSVGSEIDISKVEKILNRLPQFFGLKSDRAMPEYIELGWPPIFVDLGKRKMKIFDKEEEFRINVRIYNIGAISILFKMPFSCEIKELLKFSKEFVFKYGGKKTSFREMSKQIKDRTEESLKEYIKPIYEATKSIEIPETYKIFCISKIENGKIDASNFLKGNKRVITGILREEDKIDKISETEINEAIKFNFSYFSNDLVIVDWGSSLIIEPSGKYEDYLLVTELALLQLLKLRVYDEIVDKKIAKAHDDLKKLTVGGMKFVFLGKKIEQTVREISELRIKMSEILENTRNITKFIGDYTLAKHYSFLSERLHLDDWEKTINEKLSTLAELYTIASDKIDVHRSEMIEILIVIIFLIELILLVIELFK
ncbi:MAG: hypothetical protein OH319_04140 [Candidatus Parvarchaeota archaeon]|nr:hypothetical protein [Candidatus Jingweiarchaeum tengchongense]MCW1298023.1 hypothetical protein [Candidatus Jingweiarchaeum tengchongense]MCW1310939.1 hypothetical protein [Candidatus Jingweiarchaeum tengchongense]